MTLSPIELPGELAEIVFTYIRTYPPCSSVSDIYNKLVLLILYLI